MKSVLIVDDNSTIRRALDRVFEDSGFSVCGEAGNGIEAIEKLQQSRPDVIVMDLSMPLMNGMQAAPLLRKLQPEVPIILYSEYSDLFSDKELTRAGFAERVSKSENIAVLVAKVRVLAEHAAH